MRKLFFWIILVTYFAAAFTYVLTADAQETTTRLTPEATTNNAVQVLSGPLRFENNKIYYVHPEALEGVTQITLDGLQNTWIHFLGELKGSQMYWTTYGESEGILNVVDCQDVTITGLNVENTYTYRPGNVILETSCAVNVCRSEVTFTRCDITSNGKCALVAHSGSDVTIEDSVLNAYYFEIMAGASDVTARRCTFNQDHVTPDSHSAIWVGSSMRNGETNVLYENTNVVVEDSIFFMHDGRSMVSGNGSYTTMSNVHFKGVGVTVRDQTFGLVTWHENFNSITVTSESSSWHNEGIVDYVSASDGPGVGRFVNYYTTPTTPGGVGGVAPITVDGVSSADVTP